MPRPKVEKTLDEEYDELVLEYSTLTADTLMVLDQDLTEKQMVHKMKSLLEKRAYVKKTLDEMPMD